MILPALGFVTGVWWLHRLPELPAAHWLWALAVPLGLWWWRPRWRPVLALGAGFLWALGHALWFAPQPLAPALEGRDLILEGRLLGLPEVSERRTRFRFQVERALLEGADTGLRGRVRLSWYRNAPRLAADSRWRLQVRLKRPHGFLNPGGFDYEGWLYRQGLGATGYVRPSTENRLLEPAPLWSLDRWRQRLGQALDQALAGRPQAGLVRALALGDRSSLSSDQWEAFTLTGTNHLIAISGLHIGIVAGLCFVLGRRLWSLVPRLPLLLAAPRAAALVALAGAAVYAALAGFSVPTRRALIMLLVVLGGLLMRRAPGATNSLGLALLLVTALDPPAVLAAGFWLSFLAVAAILYGISGRLPDNGLWRRWGRTQWLVFLGLFPLLLLLFQRVSLVAPLVNLLAVPWFSLVIVPLLLLGASLLPLGLGIWPLKLAEGLLGWSLSALEWVGSWPLASWQPAAAPGWVWWPAAAGVLLLLAPRGLPGRWLGAVLLLPLLLVRLPGPAAGEIWLGLLDVGQGLSAVLRTRSHTLVYDLGPRFSDSFDAATGVLLPYLRRAGVSEIDLLVLSNADADHAGAADKLLRQIPVRRLLSGEAAELAELGAAPCRAGTEWTWDRVRFRLLHPPSGEPWRSNDSSCVLAVENAAGRILLPGDIEAPAERALLAASGGELASRILLAPHHGSATSSTPELVAAVRPDYVLYSTGYRNRFGFPRQEVQQRWSGVGALGLATADTGAIEFRLGADGRLHGPRLARQRQRRHWTHLPPELRNSPFFPQPGIQ